MCLAFLWIVVLAKVSDLAAQRLSFSSFNGKERYWRMASSLGLSIVCVAGMVIKLKPFS